MLQIKYLFLGLKLTAVFPDKKGFAILLFRCFALGETNLLSEFKQALNAETHCLINLLIQL